MKRRVLIGIIIILFLTSLLFGVLFLREKRSASKLQNLHPYLAKRLLLENPSDVIINFQPLRKQVDEYLRTLDKPYSFYFEYLFTGTSIRNGESNQLVGASLMKIPIVMDLYKASEQNKIDLDVVVVVPAEAINRDIEYGNTSALKAGDKISLREAARHALIESDNTAAYIVYSATQNLLPPDEQSINNLDVPIREETTDEGGRYVRISAQSYSSFLKCLYFSCFLTADHSQEILSYLAQSPDEGRIKAGVPNDTEVAHKIGAFSATTQSDCGIVYIPNRRYIICFMVQDNAQAAAAHLKNLSKLAYDYVSAAN